MINNSDIILSLLAGFALDCILGDPQWLPHPIRIFGSAISRGEKQLNTGENRKIKGALLALFLILFTFFVLRLFFVLLAQFEILSLILSSVFVFYGLANHSLIRESLHVIRQLRLNGVVAGRKQLSRIVGRDTSSLSENEIRTAVLETLAENLSDGVVAPLFYYAIGGVPAMMAYKMANTLDSMIGYKNKRYTQFGWFAAKLDDVLNFIPARLTAFLMVLITLNYRGLKYIFKYGNKHASPNAGYPEAALAGILNCKFGGPNMYHGVLVDKPFIGKNNKTITDKDVIKACIINSLVCLCSLLIIVSIYLFLL
ncbi:adenosylcobinamide-phosphate synthase CbiB [uncultured Draconibacterium sp.]|uniref:adenosylcobinamide-phosphate synthase CbiB n=1 Tax=uncultured Draconibacterium sp. TaxID=1573823 RepID=UPI00321713BC